MWEPLKDWEDVYEIHPAGLVRRKGQEKPLGMWEVGAGYLSLRLSKLPRRKLAYIHRLVAKQWLPQPPDTEVDHKDNNKHHNALGNLQWLTHQQNAEKRCKQRRAS